MWQYHSHEEENNFQLIDKEQALGERKRGGRKFLQCFIAMSGVNISQGGREIFDDIYMCSLSGFERWEEERVN